MNEHGRKTTYIAVIGAGEATERQIDDAEEVGRLLATGGAVLICGGLGGVMHAAARGCTVAGGTAVGILPGDGRSVASPHLSIAVATGLGEARNAIVVRAADVVIAIGGEFGTLSEIGLALRMGTTVIGLATWSLEREPEADDPLVRADSPEEAVREALRAARANR